MKVVQAKCPGCQKPLRVPENLLGGKVRCKHCGKIFQFRSSSPKNSSPAPKADTPRFAGKAETPPAMPRPKAEKDTAERIEAVVATQQPPSEAEVGVL